jgi:CheY-like chemotaxis protein
VREIVTANLRGAGYQVLEASNGEEALEVAGARVGELDLVVTDRIMPRMGGDVLAERLRRLRPDLPVLLMSGYAESPTPEGLGAPVDLLAKPFSRSELLRKAAALRAGAAPSAQLA